MKRTDLTSLAVATAIELSQRMEAHDMTDTLLTPEELAERWSLSLRALESRRTKGQPPTFIRLGQGPRARVRYRLADIEAYEAANTKENDDARADS